MLPLVRRALLLLVFAFAFVSVSEAQITNVTDDVATPIPGAGHDYIRLLSETVNPANGSLSLRISVPLPKGRGITLPFSFGYDSDGVHHILGAAPVPGQAEWQSNTDSFAQGGWSYDYPSLKASQWTVQVAVLTGNNNGQPVYTYYPCNYESSYLFRDASGGTHAMGVGALWTSNPPPGGCIGGPSVTGGDAQTKATLTTDGQGQVFALPATVFDAAGTVYYFPTLPGGGFPTSSVFSGVPAYIEDRNGNKVTATQNGNTSFSFTDTLGRTLISVNGFGPSGATNTLTFPGMSYQVTWKTATASFSVPSTQIPEPGTSCVWPTNASDSQVVISKITLPNGQFYQFYYGTDNPDPNFQNPYGLLSEIIYPSGGWVKYQWKLSDTMNEFVAYAAQASGGQLGDAVPDGCTYQYKTPVVASRQVGFGASANPSLTQSFTYSTTWNSAGVQWVAKNTQVTTTDSVRSPAVSALTSYSYSPVPAAAVPFADTSYPGQIPVESSTAAYNWGNTSNPLRTVTKTW